MTTINFWAENVDEAIRWCSVFLGIEPYAIQPADLTNGEDSGEGQFHLQLVPAVSTQVPDNIALWMVEDLEAALSQAMALGAAVCLSSIDWPTPTSASVIDQNGNTLGTFHTPAPQITSLSHAA